MACAAISSQRRLSASSSLHLNASVSGVGRQRRDSIWVLYVLAICVSASQLLPAAGAARVRHYRWEVSQQYKSPDCFKKLAVVVNGQSPGPTIRAQQGDTIIVEVKNSLHGENTAIHFHGIRQIETSWSDGTEGVTQCPILPGEIFIYKFVVDRQGSYLYHAHYGMQRSAGLYGSIQVALPDDVLEPFRYDYDRSIILDDWWHKSTAEQSVGLSSIPFGWVNEPESLLINGRGRFNCTGLTADVCNTTNPECSPYTLNVVAGKTYRLRVSSMTSLSALNFEIEGHNMTVVEADGHYVQPFVVKNLNIYSGETYSVLITANQDPTRNYWIATNVVSRQPKTTTGLGILHYHRTTPPRRLPPTVPPSGPLWNDTAYRVRQSQQIRALEGHVITPPVKPDRVMIFLNTQNEIDGYKRWAVNNVSFTLPQIPYLVALKRGLLHAFTQTPPPETYDLEGYDIRVPPPNKNATYSDGIYRLGFNTTVDVILQNANMLDPNKSETHPWHLHGHDFWVLAHGEGKFNPVEDTKKYNLVDPIMKNTVAVHPYGWTAIRFRADNPGVWAFHCHIESHFFLGMGVVFAEGVDRIERLPPHIMGCGES